jgi:hypothetical protein
MTTALARVKAVYAFEHAKIGTLPTARRDHTTMQQLRSDFRQSRLLRRQGKLYSTDFNLRTGGVLGMDGCVAALTRKLYCIYYFQTSSIIG